MNFSFKNLPRLALLAMAIGIGACAPSGPPSPDNDLELTPKSLSITKALPRDTSDVRVVCGCPFRLTVDGYTGDTAMIHYSIPLLAQPNAVERFTILVTGEPTAPTGTYTSMLALKGGVENFRDTVTITYIVP